MTKNVIIGIAVAVVVAATFNVGLQFIIWGNDAPIWYIAWVIPSSLILGFVGAEIGHRYD